MTMIAMTIQDGHLLRADPLAPLSSVRNQLCAQGLAFTVQGSFLSTAKGHATGGCAICHASGSALACLCDIGRESHE